MSSPYTTIGEIAVIYDGPHATPAKTENGPYFLSISSLNNGRLDLEVSAHLSEHDYKQWTRRVTPEAGDILFSYETRLGEAALMPNHVKACLGRRMGILRPKKAKVTPQFLLYAYISPFFQQEIVRNTIKGATVDRIALNELANFKIRIPKMEIQQKIAAILSALDAKIDCNKRINAQLEALAKTLYDYWFVQFDFPDAQGRPYKSSGGKMVYNSVLKREIPEGWGVRTLSQIAKITMGQSPLGESFNAKGDGKVFFQGSTDFGWRFPTIRQFTTSPTRYAQKGDILLSVRAPVGDLNIASIDCCIGRGLAALSSREGFDGFLFYVMSNFKKVFNRRNVEGTTFGSITKDDLHTLPLLYPEKAQLIAYEKIVASYNQIIFNKSFENQHLAHLRDWLLPMLMNGQVTVV